MVHATTSGADQEPRLHPQGGGAKLLAVMHAPLGSRPRPPLHWGWLLALGIAAVVVRLWRLDADPPLWLPNATAMDEGLWADGARGKIHFDDWFADDTGNAFLAAPVYNALVYGVYLVAGPSLWSTRLVAALCSLALLVLVYGFTARMWSRRDAALVSAVLALCPFLWAHSRFALIEVPQVTAIVASFVLLFAQGRVGVCRALGAGLCMALAVGIKPNAVVFGVLPLSAAWAVRWWLRAQGGVGGSAAGAHREHLRASLAVVGGGAAGLLAIAWWAWIPQVDEWWDTLHYEGGVGRSGWRDHLLRLGFWGSREAYPGTHALWGPLRSAPLICVAGWLYALWTTLRWSWGGRPLRLRIERWEWPVLAWCVVTFVCAEFSYQQVARRTLHLMAPMALLGGAWWFARRDHMAEMAGLIVSERRHVAVRGALWALLTWPFAIAAKPTMCNAMRGTVADWFGIDLASGNLADRSAAAGAAGLLFLGAWLVLVLAMSTLRADPQRFTSRVMTRLGPTVLLLLALIEGFLLVQHLVNPSYSIVRMQQEAQELVPEGDVVFGSHASLLLLDKPVRTVRWTKEPSERDYYSGPRPNPDALERLQPRFIITAVARNKREPEYRDLVDEHLPDGSRMFEAVRHLAYIIEPGDYGRFILQLYRRYP